MLDYMKFERLDADPAILAFVEFALRRWQYTARRERGFEVNVIRARNDRN